MAYRVLEFPLFQRTQVFYANSVPIAERSDFFEVLFKVSPDFVFESEETYF